MPVVRESASSLFACQRYSNARYAFSDMQTMPEHDRDGHQRGRSGCPSHRILQLVADAQKPKKNLTLFHCIFLSASSKIRFGGNYCFTATHWSLGEA